MRGSVAGTAGKFQPNIHFNIKLSCLVICIDTPPRKA